MNINGGFDVAPKSQGESSIECVAKSEVKVVMMANHMHEYGIAARTDVVRAGTGVVDVLRDDPVWDYEMQFNPEYAIWPAHDPLVIRPGDTLRTTCSWTNSTTENLGFPREMCGFKPRRTADRVRRGKRRRGGLP